MINKRYYILSLVLLLVFIGCSQYNTSERIHIELEDNKDSIRDQLVMYTPIGSELSEVREFIDHKLYLPKPYRFNDTLYDWPQPVNYVSNSPKIEMAIKARNDWPGDKGIDGLFQAQVGVSSFMAWKKITVAQWVFNDDKKLERIYVSIIE